MTWLKQKSLQVPLNMFSKKWVMLMPLELLQEKTGQI